MFSIFPVWNLINLILCIKFYIHIVSCISLGKAKAKYKVKQIIVWPGGPDELSIWSFVTKGNFKIVITLMLIAYGLHLHLDKMV